MRRITWLFLFIACLIVAFIVVAIFTPMRSAHPVRVRGAYAIEHVNIVDVKTGSIISNMTVQVSSGRIASIVKAKDYTKSQEFTSISAAGKYLIPGLWDMHTHSLKLSPQLHHPLFIANGVTAVRDMSGCMSREDNYWGCIEDRGKWNSEALAGARVSPRYILQSSYQLNGANVVPEGFPSFFKLEKDGDAQEVADFYQAAGADFIKAYTELSLEQYDDLVEAASTNNLDIAGHRPIKVSLEHAIRSGQKSIEHGRLFLFECYENIEEFRDLDNPILAYNTEFMQRLLERQDEEKCNELMGLMAASETWWVPTLTILKMSAFANDSAFRADPRLEYIPYVTKKLIWFPDANRAAEAAPDDSGRYVHKEFYKRAQIHVNQASQHGVKLLAGTDSIDTYVFTGSSLHDELAMMVDAGLSPLEALQAATISAATFSGLNKEFGTIETGKAADLLLLNANPLDDISNTKDISAVVFHGYYYDRDALDSLTKYVSEQANSVQVNVRFLWDALSSPLMRMQLAD